MMRKLLTIFFFAISSGAFASLDNCFKDAETNANHWHAVNPSPDCASVIKSLENKVTLTSSDKKIHIYGLKNMFFVEANGKIELMAGDQTELSEILKFSLNEKKQKLLVLQNDSVSTFRIDFIGNVAPVKHFKSKLLRNTSSVKLLDEVEMIAIFKPAQVFFVNADAESRHADKRFKPRMLHELKGSESGLINPVDAFVGPTGVIYVLDSERVLVFKNPKLTEDRPEKIIPAIDAKLLKFSNGKLYYIKTNGDQFEIPLMN